MDAGGKESGSVEKPKTKHLTKDEVNSFYISGLKDIDATIENYREALQSRGINDEKWLTDFLNVQKVHMTQQLTNDIEVGAGNADPQKIYQEPGDFTAFYDSVYQEYLKRNK